MLSTARVAALAVLLAVLAPAGVLAAPAASPPAETAALFRDVAALMRASGSVNSAAAMGLLYLKGDGADPVAAAAWFERGAQAGDPLSTYVSARMEAYGIGQGKNPEEAKRLLSALARKDLAGRDKALSQKIAALDAALGVKPAQTAARKTSGVAAATKTFTLEPTAVAPKAVPVVPVAIQTLSAAQTDAGPTTMQAVLAAATTIAAAGKGQPATAPAAKQAVLAPTQPAATAARAAANGANPKPAEGDGSWFTKFTEIFRISHASPEAHVESGRYVDKRSTNDAQGDGEESSDGAPSASGAPVKAVAAAPKANPAPAADTDAAAAKPAAAPPAAMAAATLRVPNMILRAINSNSAAARDLAGTKPIPTPVPAKTALATIKAESAARAAHTASNGPLRVVIARSASPIDLRDAFDRAAARDPKLFAGAAPDIRSDGDEAGHAVFELAVNNVPDAKAAEAICRAFNKTSCAAGPADSQGLVGAAQPPQPQPGAAAANNAATPAPAAVLAEAASAADAAAMLRNLAATFGPYLVGHQIAVADGGAPPSPWRVLVTGFTQPQEAAAFCQSIAMQGRPCAATMQ